jgi:hypothetical protein
MRILSKKEEAVIDQDYAKTKSVVIDALKKKDFSKMVTRKTIIKSITGLRHSITFMFSENSLNIEFDNKEAVISTKNRDAEAISMSAVAIEFAMMHESKEITSAVINHLIKTVIKAVLTVK